LIFRTYTRTVSHRISKAFSILIKACIFDLDGVIVDTARYHYLSWKRLASEIGVELTEADNERLKGVSRRRSLDIILELGKISMSEAEKEKLAEKKNTWFVDYLGQMSPDEIFPGVKELIRQFGDKGIKVGLASSSKNAKAVVEILKIQDDFDAVVDGSMIVHSKPNPEIFLLAAKQLGIKPADCVVFEDAAAGVDAALAAGMKCVGVGSRELLSHANKVVSKTAEFRVQDLEEL
jgi:beta-phosphoglucomutase